MYVHPSIPFSFITVVCSAVESPVQPIALHPTKRNHTVLDALDTKYTKDVPRVRATPHVRATEVEVSFAERPQYFMPPDTNPLSQYTRPLSKLSNAKEVLETTEEVLETRKGILSGTSKDQILVPGRDKPPMDGFDAGNAFSLLSAFFFDLVYVCRTSLPVRSETTRGLRAIAYRRVRLI